MALEIERKFLLKNLPNLDWDIVYNITQIYCNDKAGHGYRLRRRAVERPWWLYLKDLFTGENKTEYFKTIKKKIKDGVYEEDETTITKEEYWKDYPQQLRILNKIRYVKYVTDDLKWEVDDYGKLVIAEIELADIDQTVDLFPIMSLLIKDVTDQPEFTNYRLAEH